MSNTPHSEGNPCQLGISSLALVTGEIGPSILPSLAVMKPRRLSIGLRLLFHSIPSIDLSHTAFTLVTHLEVFDYCRSTPRFPVSNLALLPALTHLALCELNGAAVGTQLLSANMKIEVLIRLQGGGSYPDPNLPVIDDARFVSMSVLDEEHASDWLAGIRSGMNFWVRAARSKLGMVFKLRAYNFL
ncbi:hypothetical protein FB451DRAFT_1166632 [Mycena latifolia]|nr:hypothetical protein FB451DRAFT_1166632 [Mycena latifolia]